jgi:hypothetical protein
MIHRRSFLERLGLGAGALLLGPTIGASVREAHGQSAARKRLFLMVQGNWAHFADFAPFGHTPGELKVKGVPDGQLYVADSIQMPPAFAALEPHKKNVLLVDGLSNYQGAVDHGSGAACLSCVPNRPMGPGAPGGPSFDQYAAQTLGKDMAFPSIVLGPSGGADQSPVRTTVFAAGANLKRPVLAGVQAAYDSVFGGLVPGAAGAIGRRRKLLDLIRGDVKRARLALAGPESAKLDQMASAVEELDLRMTRLGALAFDRGLVSDLSARMAAGAPRSIEDQLDLHFQIATTALIARLTNVIGFSAECSVPSAEIQWPTLGIKDCHEMAHMRYNDLNLDKGAPGNPDYPMLKMYNYHAGMLARTVAALQKVPEGSGTMFDSTVLTWQGESVDQHHPTYVRAPVVAIAAPGGFLKTGGRFVRYPLIRPTDGANLVQRPTREILQGLKPKGAGALADWFCTLGYALGIPTDGFGGGTAGPSPDYARGPLAELRA